MIVMGIDPGSIKTGVAVLRSYSKAPVPLKKIEILDTITLESSPRHSFNDRLGQFHKVIVKLIEEINPNYCVIESCFYGKNVQSALKLGHIRGSIISAVKRFSLPIIEIAPTQMKKSIAGRGHAKKEEVAFALKTLLDCPTKKMSLDASDALGLALTFLLNLQYYSASENHLSK